MSGARPSTSMNRDNGPPRLQLELNTSTTSFKRTFEDLGLELDEPSTSSSVTGDSQGSTFERSPQHNRTSSSPSSTRSSKRSRSEDLESEGSFSGGSGSGTHNQREQSLNVELRPIESISPIMDSFSLPWHNSPHLPSRVLQQANTDLAPEQVDVQMRPVEHSPFDPAGSVADPHGVRGTPLRLQSNFSALPFHEPESPQDPSLPQAPSPRLVGEEISRSSSATDSSSAASLHTLGLPEQDFFGPGSLRSTTPPWLRGLRDRPILPMPIVHSDNMGHPSLSSFFSQPMDGNTILPDISAHHNVPSFGVEQDAESAPASPMPRESHGHQQNTGTNTHPARLPPLPPIPITEALTFDAPLTIPALAPATDPLFAIPPLTRVLQNPQSRRPILYSRRSSSSMGFHRSSLESLLNDYGSRTNHNHINSNNASPQDRNMSVNANANVMNHDRIESPLIPMPPAPRAGTSYHYDMFTNEWVPGQAMPGPSIPASPLPFPHLHTSNSNPNLNSNPPRPGSIRAPRLGFLELVPSPSPSYSTRRWNRFIASPVGDDVSIGPSTPSDERVEWPEPSRALETPLHSEASRNAPLLLAPPSGNDYRNREAPIQPPPLSVFEARRNAIQNASPTGSGSSRRSASPVALEHRSPDQPPQLSLPSLNQPLVDLSSPIFGYQEFPAPVSREGLGAPAPPPIEAYLHRTPTPGDNTDELRSYPVLDPLPRLPNTSTNEDQERRRGLLDRFLRSPENELPEARRINPGETGSSTSSSTRDLHPFHSSTHRTLLNIGRDQRRRNLLTPLRQNLALGSNQTPPNRQRRSEDFSTQMRGIFDDAAQPFSHNSSTVSNTSRSPPLDLHLDGFNASFDEDEELGGYLSGDRQEVRSRILRARTDEGSDEEGSISSTRAVTSITRPRDDIVEADEAESGDRDYLDPGVPGEAIYLTSDTSSPVDNSSSGVEARTSRTESFHEVEEGPSTTRFPERNYLHRDQTGQSDPSPSLSDLFGTPSSYSTHQSTLPRLSLPRFPSLMDYASGFATPSRQSSGSNSPQEGRVEQYHTTRSSQRTHQRSVSLTGSSNQPQGNTFHEAPRPRAGELGSFLRPFSRGVRPRNDSLDSSLPRARWAPTHRSGNSPHDLYTRPGSTRPSDSMFSHPIMPVGSRTPFTRGEAQNATPRLPTDSRTDGNSNSNSGIGSMSPLDAVSQERHLLHELMMRRARGHVNAEQHRAESRHNHIGIGHTTGRSTSYAHHTGWHRDREDWNWLVRNTPHRHDHNHLNRTANSNSVQSQPGFNDQTSEHSSDSHRSHPLHFPILLNTRTNSTSDPHNRTTDQSNLARSFSSMEELFRDFDQRHGSNAVTPPLAGGGGLGAESYVPWRHPMGDYMMDDEFDGSYDGLIRLGAILGEVRSRGTPEEVVNGLPTATFREWSTEGNFEARCPICLEDYAEEDPTRRLPECRHWFHKDCISQWLQTARTCPVCRKMLKIPRSTSINLQHRRPRGGATSRLHRTAGDVMRNWTFGPAPAAPP